MSDPHTEPDVAQGRDPLAPQPHPPLAAYNSPPAYGSSQPPLASGSHRAIAAVAGVLLGLLLVVAAGLMAGASAERLARFDFSLAATLPAVGFTLLSVAIVVGLVITARFSSVGVHLAGIIQILVGVLYSAAPMILYSLVAPFRSISRGVDYYLVSGAPILVGSALIAAGVVISGLRRKARTNGPAPAAFR